MAPGAAPETEAEVAAILRRRLAALPEVIAAFLHGSFREGSGPGTSAWRCCSPRPRRSPTAGRDPALGRYLRADL